LQYDTSPLSAAETLVSGNIWFLCQEPVFASHLVKVTFVLSDISRGRLKTRERTTRDQVAGVDDVRIFGIDHSDKFRSNFVSVLVYCYLISFYVGTYCFVGLLVQRIKMRQKSMQNQFHYTKK